ncbi:MAG: cytochrome c biogenesis protein CcsA [Bacteroidales bacterium]|jgi:ABC-type transport system involved in cytochrome c biogenesis permease subunit|nr:cytochrome c biogenesis protein CcsA [Bacteroidales bacterium]
MWKRFRLFLGIYAGLTLVISAGFLGRNDLQQLKMLVVVDEAEWRATNEKNGIVELPFVIELKSFTIEEYPSGKPKSFTSDITVYTPNGEKKEAQIKVNKPLTVSGWKIYQHSYDKTFGNLSRYSVFKIVKDPWLPVVYTGFFLIFAGTFYLLFLRFRFKTLKIRKITIVSLMGIFLFSCLIANVWFSPLRMRSLMPALQSIWFIPHVSMYILAYSLLSVAVIYAIFLLIKKNNTEKLLQYMVFYDDLVYTGTVFLTSGILIGAVWAKDVWGHYWSWDPKETWAAITWLAFMFCIHFRHFKHEKIKPALLLLFFSYLLLQICWFGVKYLPFLQEGSVHIYRNTGIYPTLL